MPDDHDDDGQLELFPPYQRHSPTSRAAAAEIEPRAHTLRAAVLRVLREHGGMTDEEIQRLLAMDGSTERPRRVELERLGLVVDSGERRLTEARRAAVVWKATR